MSETEFRRPPRTAWRSCTTLVAAVAVAAGLVGAAPAASAAEPVRATVAAGARTSAVAAALPPRNDNVTNAVYFVHGYTGAQQHDCREVWGPALRYYRDQGWRGPLHTWGYYRNNRNCGKNYAGTANVPLTELGRRLAWEIYNAYTRRGLKADVVAHSMGGLVARAAVDGVRDRTPGWPTRLYVEDVVTLSTPHLGTGWARTCWRPGKRHVQCRDMLNGSAFLRSLASGPQSTIGTDWSLVGSGDDDIVTWQSATAAPDGRLHAGIGHRYKYRSGQNLEHNVILKIQYGTNWRQDVWHHHRRSWVFERSTAPLRRALYATQYWSWR